MSAPFERITTEEYQEGFPDRLPALGDDHCGRVFLARFSTTVPEGFTWRNPIEVRVVIEEAGERDEKELTRLRKLLAGVGLARAERKPYWGARLTDETGMPTDIRFSFSLDEGGAVIPDTPLEIPLGAFWPHDTEVLGQGYFPSVKPHKTT